MLQQKVSEPTRNSLWEEQDEVASGQGFFSSTDLPPLSKQLSSTFPVLVSVQALDSLIHVPFVPQFSSCCGTVPCPSPDLLPLWLGLLRRWGDSMCQRA